MIHNRPTRELGLLSDSEIAGVQNQTRSITHCLFHFCIHNNPPTGAESLHSPYGNTTPNNADDTQASEQPAVSNRSHQGLRDDGGNARQNVSYEIVQSNTMRSFAWHEFRELDHS
jgi:hypothetical protein